MTPGRDGLKAFRLDSWGIHPARATTAEKAGEQLPIGRDRLSGFTLQLAVNEKLLPIWALLIAFGPKHLEN